MAAKFAWMLWALVPVAGVAYHFGPGQKPYNEDRAADVLADAQVLEARADLAQAVAHEAHLASLQARRAMQASKSPEAEAAARSAASQEDEAYRVAAEAWRLVAEKLQQAQDVLGGAGEAQKRATIRIARDRALVRSGKIAEGVGDLEALLEDFAETSQEEAPLARMAREELATGYYYGARLMRIAGKPDAEWREVSGWSRRNFRYLAESTTDSSQSSKAENLQKNLELVLNLEQAAQEDLLAMPLPKGCPQGNCNGLGECKGKNKTKRPPRSKKDARGAGGVGDVDGGW